MRLMNDSLSRILHNALYQRLLSFCNQYTPEYPAEPIVTHWLSRLYSGDDNLHILVVLDKSYSITAHCVVDIQHSATNTVIFCHQVQADKGSGGSIDEYMEYMDKLASSVNAHCICVNVAKHSKALETKYNYKTTRTVMLKYGEGYNET